MPSRRIARTQAKKAALLQAQQEEAALYGPPAPQAEEEEEDLADEFARKVVIKDIVAIPPHTQYQLATDQILHLFHRLFQSSFTDTTELQSTIQAVKTDLYNRDYLDAFDDDAKRLAYLIRWSSLRALSYASLMSSLTPIVEMISEYIIEEDEDEDCQCLLIGGGASAEIVGLAAIYGRMKEFCSTKDKPLQINVMDVSDWGSIVTQVTNEINTLGWIRQVPDTRPQQFITNYLKNDVLTYFNGVPEKDDTAISLANQKLITLLFTTNELFQEDKSKSIQFFQRMNQECSPGTLLLIAESAGSYSNIQIGTKQFPVFFMIDMLLSNKKSELKKAGSGKKSKTPEAYDGAWELVESSDSCWYRVDKESQDFYSSRLENIKLENMRFFFRLYRKL
ncbi:hypothetical protein BABINDRAFT_158850 [Babjeviella inositovora NRRL Y-12698]|uniref:25S rRNA (Uridine(2843)-N(3))-methyltransferase n=1 Tax=Babjeviella inositovora NRRL Y-12698 TaxID=984486 RepID=A0A1E3QX19_9ASCO|nr:uncharacterized protein BABINDRAFT_158850 [Babjeviella inositovora NRRL Y-12698]ODQ82206.1 hypothetical protein BABINDRAFT_158850 [Babjeviella inositovora NRRL Y-12698]